MEFRLPKDPAATSVTSTTTAAAALVTAAAELSLIIVEPLPSLAYLHDGFRFYSKF